MAQWFLQTFIAGTLAFNHVLTMFSFLKTCGIFTA